MFKNREKVIGGVGERLIRQNILQNELIKKCLYFTSLNNWVRIDYVNSSTHGGKAELLYCSRYSKNTAETVCMVYSSCTFGQVKTNENFPMFVCLLTFFFSSLSCVLCLSSLQTTLPVFTLKSYFCKMVIVLFKPCLYESLSQREWKKRVLLTVTKLANKFEVKVCFVLLGSSLTLSKTVSGILQPHNFGEAS